MGRNDVGAHGQGTLHQTLRSELAWHEQLGDVDDKATSISSVLGVRHVLPVKEGGLLVYDPRHGLPHVQVHDVGESGSKSYSMTGMG